MTWVGLDLHKRYITACALDGVGAVVAEHHARKLADLARTNLLPVVWVPDPEVRARRSRPQLMRSCVRPMRPAFGAEVAFGPAQPGECQYH
jgi:hypothetical protein